MAPAISPGFSSTSIELINLPENGVVHHRLFILIGRVLGLAASQPDGPDGFVHVSVDGASNPALCPDQRWELNATWFKALVPLHSGHNIVKLTCTDANGNSLGQEHTFHLEYQPLPRRRSFASQSSAPRTRRCGQATKEKANQDQKEDDRAAGSPLRLLPLQQDPPTQPQPWDLNPLSMEPSALPSSKRHSQAWRS